LEEGSHDWTYRQSLKLLDSSNRDLLILVNDLAVGLARREYYCSEAALFLFSIMRKRKCDEKRRNKEQVVVVVNRKRWYRA